MNLVNSLIILAILSVSASSGLYGYRVGMEQGFNIGFNQGFDEGYDAGNPLSVILDLIKGGK